MQAELQTVRMFANISVNILFSCDFKLYNRDVKYEIKHDIKHEKLMFLGILILGTGIILDCFCAKKYARIN